MNCNNTKNFQSLLDNIGVATMIFNADAVVTACNSASEKLLGYGIENLGSGNAQ
jgi:PAS domain-containing protein